MTARQKRVLSAIVAMERDSAENEVTPRQLWMAARAEDHPLHGEFEWDDSVAAESWRDEQARRLLRLRISVTYEDRVVSAPICVRSPDHEAGEAGYTLTSRVVGDEERSRKVMLEEVVRAARAIERAKLVAEALGLGGDCALLLERLTQIETKLRTAA